MTPMTPMPSRPDLGNLVPYLFYDDVASAIEWYERVFGFVERGRWPGPDGTVENAELLVGDTELWLDGGGRARMPEQVWVGIWLADRAAVDAMHDHVVAQGVEPLAPPADRPFGIRTFDVVDPAGYRWGFMTRIPPTATA